MEPRARTEHCKGAHVCLVGANCFQNNMFVTTLQQMYHCQNSFHVVPSLSDIPQPLLCQPDYKIVFYFDCFGFNPSEIEALLYAVPGSIQPKLFYALFNLNKDIKIEKKALKYGVRGFFYLNDSPADFCNGTRKILCDEVWVSRKLASEVIIAGAHPLSHLPRAEVNYARLTDREKTVLSHLLSGETNMEIAAKLFISPHTLRTHLNHIYKKLNVKTRMQAIRWAEVNLR